MPLARRGELVAAQMWPELEVTLATDRQRVWTTADMLALIPAERTPAGTSFDYSDTNYLLLHT